MTNFYSTDRAVPCLFPGFWYKGGVNACKTGEALCSCVAVVFFCKDEDHGSCEGFHFHILDCAHAVFTCFIFL